MRSPIGKRCPCSCTSPARYATASVPSFTFAWPAAGKGCGCRQHRSPRRMPPLTAGMLRHKGGLPHEKDVQPDHAVRCAPGCTAACARRLCCLSGCSAVPGSSGSSAVEPSPSPAAAEPAAKPDLPSLRPLYQGDENGYYTFMTAASGDYQQVLYADYQTGTQAPACHITGCTHDSPSCPACFLPACPSRCPARLGTALIFPLSMDMIPTACPSCG